LGKKLANGITFVDINNDGYKDIYVSQGGPKDRNDVKKSTLYKHKDFKLLLKAEEYGLADMGNFNSNQHFSINDKRGDLDLRCLNENEILWCRTLYFLQNNRQTTKIVNISTALIFTIMIMAKIFERNHFFRNSKSNITD